MQDHFIKELQKDELRDDLPEFNAGDTITVYYLIREGGKQRVQPFRGIVLQLRGTGLTKTFMVRKESSGIGVERIFPLHTPRIQKIEVNQRGKVRRKRIFYLRQLKGKKSKVKERKV